jgi:hypothetical protein
MVIDALLENYYVPNLFYSIQVVEGQSLTLIADVMPEGAFAFSYPDKCLDVEQVGKNIKIDAVKVGRATVRIMTDPATTLREIIVDVVESVGLPATSINASFEPAVPR